MTDKNDAQLPLEEVLHPTDTNSQEPPKVDPGARRNFQEKEKQAQDEGKADIQRARDEAGKYKQSDKEKTDEKKEVKEAKPDTKVLEDFQRKYNASIAQANAERTKRQELERRLAELEKKKEPEEPFWDAPDKALKRMQDEIKQQNQEFQNNIRSELVRSRLNSSEQVARSKHADFDEAIATFSEMCTENPALGTQWLNSSDPGEFAYKQGKTAKQLKDVGDPDKLREQIRKEERLKLEEELKEKEEKLKAEREALPGSLSDARGVTQNKFVWTGPTPLGEILKH